MPSLTKLCLCPQYGIETPGAKTDAVLRWVTEQKAAGVPIDGVGFQSHLTCNCPGCNDTATIAATMQRYVKAGFKVWVTELDVQMVEGCTEEDQAAVYSAVLGACLSLKEHCDSFMVWGFTVRALTTAHNHPAAPGIVANEPSRLAGSHLVSDPVARGKAAGDLRRRLPPQARLLCAAEAPRQLTCSSD